MQKNFSRSELLIFYRHFLALTKAGLPVARALKVIFSQSNNRLKKVISRIVLNLEQGNSLADSLELAGLPAEDVNCIRVGEESGKLEGSFALIVAGLDQSIASLKKIKKALTYPAMVLFLSLLSVIFLVCFVVPGFQNIFSEFNLQLPLLTRILISVSANIQIIMLLLAGLTVVFWRLGRREEAKEKLPFFGRVYKSKMISRICRGLGYQLLGGVPILRSIETVAAGLPNKTYSTALNRVSVSLQDGARLSAALKKTLLFPAPLIEIINVGEESGSLAAVLIQSADYYDQEAEDLAGRLIGLVEPVSTLAVGGVVGVIVFSMIAPLFKMLEAIQ